MTDDEIEKLLITKDADFSCETIEKLSFLFRKRCFTFMNNIKIDYDEIRVGYYCVSTLLGFVVNEYREQYSEISFNELIDRIKLDLDLVKD